MLREYAEFCLCWQHLPMVHQCPTVLDSWVHKWLAELQALYDSMNNRRDVGDGGADERGPLYPQTTVDEPTSEDESADVEGPPVTNTPLKREISDLVTPVKTMPGTYPSHDVFNSGNHKAAAGHLSPYTRRSSMPETPPNNRRYSQTVRKSPLGATPEIFKRATSAKAEPLPKHTEKFVPYRTKVNPTLLNVLNRPLGDNSAPGHVYIFTRRSEKDRHQHFIKIGVTKNVEDRFRQRKGECHYMPHWEYQTALIPNAVRVESLVHTELFELRYVERECSGCGNNHDEWFKTDVDTGRLVVGRWARWMEECRPYTPEGKLSPHLVMQIFDHNLSKKPLTGEDMLRLKSDSATSEAATQPSPKDRHLAGGAGQIERHDPASPTLRKSTRTAPAVDLPTTSDEEDNSEPMQRNSPLPNPFRMYAGTGDGRLDVKRTREQTAAVQIEIEHAVSGLASEFEEAKGKMEHDSDTIDPPLSDVEAPDLQEIYHDAASFPEPGACAVEAKSAHEASSSGQQPTARGLWERMGVPTGVQCAA